MLVHPGLQVTLEHLVLLAYQEIQDLLEIQAWLELKVRRVSRVQRVELDKWVPSDSQVPQVLRETLETQVTSAKPVNRDRAEHQDPRVSQDLRVYLETVARLVNQVIKVLLDSRVRKDKSEILGQLGTQVLQVHPEILDKLVHQASWDNRACKEYVVERVIQELKDKSVSLVQLEQWVSQERQESVEPLELQDHRVQ